ncbi:MAG: methyltransferase [Candidatus Thorarchaeota archaeon]|nr:methyltransferase [Candidatus Thorarchaeota archaeon]
MKEPRLDIRISSEVYPPSADTYLLLDSVETNPDDVLLEVGCGSGYITVNLCEKVMKTVALDIFDAAVRNTMENVERNHLQNRCDVVQSDLFSAFTSRYKFSLIIFNPPYLPQDEFKTSLDHALVGGKTGIELTEEFLNQAVEHLQLGGRIYVIVTSISDVEKIKSVMTDHLLAPTIVGQSSLFFERILVLRGILEK